MTGFVTSILSNVGISFETILTTFSGTSSLSTLPLCFRPFSVMTFWKHSPFLCSIKSFPPFRYIQQQFCIKTAHPQSIFFYKSKGSNIKDTVSMVILSKEPASLTIKMFSMTDLIGVTGKSNMS